MLRPVKTRGRGAYCLEKRRPGWGDDRNISLDNLTVRCLTLFDAGESLQYIAYCLILLEVKET